MSVPPSVRSSVHTSTKSSSDFDVIWCVGRPWPDMRTTVTSTRLKVKVQGFWSTENCTFSGVFPPLFWRGAQNWWLTVIAWDLVYSVSEPSFQFPSKKAITWLQTCKNVDITRISNGQISILLEARVCWSGTLVVLYILCILMRPCPIQGQGHGASEVPIVALFYVYLPCHFGLKLKTDSWLWLHGTYSTAFRSLIFEFPSKKAITWLHTSRNVDITRISKGHMLILFDTRVTWSVMLVVLYVLCMWYDLDPIQGGDQGYWASEVPNITLFYVYLLRQSAMQLEIDGWSW